jgi:O-antigen biosynthesis protein WbqP
VEHWFSNSSTIVKQPFNNRLTTVQGGLRAVGYLKIKRLIDIVLSLLGLIILSPVFLILIVAIKLDSKGPVLFKQKRVGIHKSHFNILKFRTMRIDTPKDTPTHLLENPDQWITKVGKFLRKISLDELPQIWNIFVGQMSIIGPRPALWNQYDLIAERDKYGANDVPVGLTGWAQINGRDELPIEVKAKLDGEYVKKIGLMMDVKCFFMTIVSVVKSDGVVEGCKVEIERFVIEGAATTEIATNSENKFLNSTHKQ